jgi:hypothetical protein
MPTLYLFYLFPMSHMLPSFVEYLINEDLMLPSILLLICLVVLYVYIANQYLHQVQFIIICNRPFPVIKSRYVLAILVSIVLLFIFAILFIFYEIF